MTGAAGQEAIDPHQADQIAGSCRAYAASVDTAESQNASGRNRSSTSSCGLLSFVALLPTCQSGRARRCGLEASLYTLRRAWPGPMPSAARILFVEKSCSGPGGRRRAEGPLWSERGLGRKSSDGQYGERPERWRAVPVCPQVRALAVAATSPSAIVQRGAFSESPVGVFASARPSICRSERRPPQTAHVETLGRTRLFGLVNDMGGASMLLVISGFESAVWQTRNSGRPTDCVCLTAPQDQQCLGAEESLPQLHRSALPIHSPAVRHAVTIQCRTGNGEGDNCLDQGRAGCGLRVAVQLIHNIQPNTTRSQDA